MRDQVQREPDSRPMVDGEAHLDGDSFTAEVTRRRLRERMFGDADGSLEVGPFELRERIGAGGMGTVYAGWDRRLARKVALEFLRRRDEEDEDAGLGEARAHSQHSVRRGDDLAGPQGLVVGWRARRRRPRTPGRSRRRAGSTPSSAAASRSRPSGRLAAGELGRDQLLEHRALAVLAGLGLYGALLGGDSSRNAAVLIGGGVALVPLRLLRAAPRRDSPTSAATPSSDGDHGGCSRS